MPDHLVRLSQQAKKRVHIGFYETEQQLPRNHQSLVQAIRRDKKTPIIAEIKYASPSSGKIRDFESPSKISKAMINGGACALSILTDPEGFQGRLDTLSQVAKRAHLPLIMKDIVVSPRQLNAGARLGADAVVLISELFSHGLAEARLGEMMEEACQLGLEVLVEANSAREFEKVRGFKPDLYGINNRNLSTFEIDLSTTERILAKTKRLDGPVVSESGMESAADIIRLRAAGAQAFLVGTSIMKSPDVGNKVREFVNA